MNLSPVAIQKFFDSNGSPLVGGKLFTYVSGTSTKQATYTSSTGLSSNTNPIILDYRGECRLWIDPELSYTFVLAPATDTDPPGAPIWTVNDITAAPANSDNAAVDTGSVNNVSLSIPSISSPVAFTRVVFQANHTNTGPMTLQINGGTAHDLVWQNLGAFAGGEVQDNGIYQAVFDGAQWQLQSPALNPTQIRTAAEVSSGVTPSSYSYMPYVAPPRYGVRGDATTDDAAAIQRQIDACVAGGSELDLWGTTASGYKIETPLEITGKLKIIGGGYGKCGIIAVGCNAFNVAAGLSQVEMRDFRINSAIRWTTTPNSLKAINIQGTTASACQYHSYENLFIDGFETAIQADGVRASHFENITTVFGKNGIMADQQTVNNRVISCLLTGNGSGSYGIKIGDGASSSEGWIVNSSVIFGFARGVWGYGSNNSKVVNCIIDFFTEYGVLIQSGAAIAATNWLISENYMAASGTASSGVRLLSSYASSDPRGNRVVDNDILVYSGSTLSYGILIDGTEETKNRILGNSLRATTYDLRITSGTTHVIDDNDFNGGGFSATTRNVFGFNSGTILDDPNVFVKRYNYITVRKNLTYSSSMTPDLNEANHFDITVTDANAFTLNLPTNFTAGETFTITIRNTSGGALGAATWTGGYKMATWTQPANGFSRSITFAYNGTLTYFEEISRTAADVPN